MKTVELRLPGTEGAETPLRLNEEEERRRDAERKKGWSDH